MARIVNARSTEKIPPEVARKLLQREAEAKAKNRQVAVYGATPIGRNLARALAERGTQVTLVDPRLSAAEEALHEIAARLTRKVERGVMAPPTQGEVLQRLRIGSGQDRLRGQDLVIEALASDRGARTETLRALDPVVEPGAPIVALVKGIRGYDLTDVAPDPSRVVPVHLALSDFEVTVVEVVEASGVSREALVKTARFFETAGLLTVRAPGVPGLLMNRLLVATITEAVGMLERGEAEIEQIDRALRIATLYNLGPLQLADLIGLDYVYELSSALSDDTGDARYAPPELLKVYVDNGYTGLKTGRGFYLYDE